MTTVLEYHIPGCIPLISLIKYTWVNTTEPASTLRRTPEGHPGKTFWKEIRRKNGGQQPAGFKQNWRTVVAAQDGAERGKVVQVLS